MTVRSRSLLGAFLLLCGGLVLSGWSAYQIRVESQQFMTGPRFERGAVAYAILQHGACVGTVKSEYRITQDGASIFLRTVLNGLDDTPLNGELSFNHLGQLMGALFEVDGVGGNLRFGSSGVDPIVAKLKGSIWGKDLDLSVPIPGPVELKAEGEGFRLIDTRGRLTAMIPTNSVAQLALDVVKSDSKNMCENSSVLTLPDIMKTLSFFNGRPE